MVVAENKKHHYVPLFYLKRFSPDGKSINLYNLRSTRTIYKAKLKNQCYSDYFYGKEPDIEHALAGLDGRFNPSDFFKYLLGKYHGNGSL